MKYNLHFPEQTAIIFGDRKYSYREFDDITDKIAVSLIQSGIHQGDRIALHLANCPEIVFCYYACFKIGAIAVPINARLKAPEIEYILSHCQAKICISQEDLFPEIQLIQDNLATCQTYFLVGNNAEFADVNQFSQLLNPKIDKTELPRIDPNAVAAISYTSGTTGLPKGVTHTHKSLQLTATYHARQVHLTHTDVCGVVLPLTHIGGIAFEMLTALSIGATLVIISPPDPILVLQNLQQNCVTYFVGMPVLFNALVNYPNADDYNLDALRICLAGGDAVPASLQQHFAELFRVEIREVCGMTEVIPYALNPQKDNRVGSIGKPARGMQLRLVNEQGQDIAPGKTGEILVKSDAMMVGYWKDPEATTAVFTDGWLHTGDLAWMDEDGYYWFVSRKKDIIIRGGSNISPLEVEGVLYQHPAIREAAVIGVPNPTWGEVVRAFVALRAEYETTAAELREFMRPRIADYKIPEKITVLSELPKGSTGKIHRQTLRDRAREIFSLV
ncbi:MAG: long-chain-fatty-acid--CoA ligase [Cyanobacteria bacterium P01_E01_bin.35]